MPRFVRDASFLPACILGGVGVMFAVLAFALPPTHAFALIVGTAIALGLVISKLRRERAENRPLERVKARV